MHMWRDIPREPRGSPRSETDARAKMAQLVPGRAGRLEAAVDALPEAGDLSELVNALRGPLD